MNKKNIKNIFYAVGVGPGDPKLLTLKALEIIKAADILAVPYSEGGNKTALDIVSGFLEEGGQNEQKILELFMPMRASTEQIKAAHDEAALKIKYALDSAQSVAFLTLGDPSVYSTASYLWKKIEDMGYETEIIPGVPSFCAAAAALHMPLAEGKEPLRIIPALKDTELCPLKGENLVLMKVGKNYTAVKEELQRQGRLECAALIERCGMEGEKIHKDLANNPILQDMSYFSTMIVKAGR